MTMTALTPDFRPSGLSEAQLAQRRKGLGGSEIAAVLGLDPFRTALDVYAEKRGLAPPFTGNAQTRAGQRLEPAILRWYAEETGRELVPSPGTVAHPREPWMLCTPDALVREVGDAAPIEVGGLEAKNRNAYAKGWGESGTELIPDSVALQCHWSLAVTLYPWWDVAVLLGGWDFRTYRVRRDPDLARELVARASVFWHEHVLAGVAPKVVGRDNPNLGRLLRQATEQLRPSSPAIEEQLADLKAARRKLADAATDVDGIEAALKEYIGDAAGIAGLTALVTWKQDRDSAVVDYKVVAAELGAADPEGFARVCEQHSTTRPGSRRFLVTWEEALTR